MVTSSSRRFIIVDDNTIQEKRDRQEERRPRKRQRVESEDEEEDVGKRDVPEDAGSAGTPPPSMPDATSVFPQTDAPRGDLQKDPDYYMEDPAAKVFVKVQNTLFKIHRELLTASPTMESCLKEHEKRKGPTTDEQPLQLSYPAVTVQEYKAFLWVLYAKIEDISKPPTMDDELVRLFNIAAITLKYAAPKMADWVAKTLLEAAKSATIMEASSSATLSHFVDIAVQKPYHHILETVIFKWCDRLMGKSTPSVPAIQTADKHEDKTAELLVIKKLKGIAYYIHVQDMADRQSNLTESGATHLRSDPKLNNGQVMRLLAAYWSLVSLWERLRLAPVHLPQSESCSIAGHEGCNSTWNRRWASLAGWKRILDHNSADILGLLSTLLDQLANDDEVRSALNAECRRGGLDAIKKLKAKTEAGLADHFVGCL